MFTLSHQVAPYTFMMYSIVYSGVFKRSPRLLRLSPYIFFIPVALMYWLYPFIPGYNPSFLVLSIWVAPYIVISNCLLFYFYLKEKDAKQKKQRLISFIILAPPTLFTLMANFVLRAFGYNKVWEYNTYTIILAFIIFIIASAKFGAMGVKLKFEKYRLDSTMKSLTSGTMILNHSVKNEIYKILICMDNIKTLISSSEQNLNNINENVEIVVNSTNHLAAMMNRIQEQTKEIVLIESSNDLIELIEESLDMAKINLRSKNIYIYKKYRDNIYIYCDRIHVIEVLINIINNAIEAMQVDGQLEISAVYTNKEIRLSIKDNGIGISKQSIPYVFDPFFSTKRLTTNFGLGLSYCYNVMQKHEGKLEILSRENVGTTVLLCFPKKRLLKVADTFSQDSLKGVL